MLLYDTVRDRQTEAGSLPDFLGREKRLEESRQHAVSDPGTVVRDFDFDTMTLDCAGTNFEPTRSTDTRQRLFGIHHDIEEGLLQQQRVTCDPREFRRE